MILDGACCILRRCLVSKGWGCMHEMLNLEHHRVDANPPASWDVVQLLIPPAGCEHCKDAEETPQIILAQLYIQKQHASENLCKGTDLDCPGYVQRS